MASQVQAIEPLSAVSDLLAELSLSQQKTASSVAPVLEPIPVTVAPKVPTVVAYTELGR